MAKSSWDSPLPQHVRTSLGTQQGLLATRLLDGLYANEIVQIQTVARAYERVAEQVVEIPVDRSLSDPNRRLMSVTITDWIESLATPEAHHGVWRVRLSDGTESAVKMMGYHREGGEFAFLQRAAKRGKSVVTPLMSEASTVNARGKEFPYRVLFTEMIHGTLLASWDSPVHVISTNSGLLPHAQGELLTMFELFSSLDEPGVVMPRAIPYSERLRYHLSVTMPALRRAGLQPPKRMGQLIAWTEGDCLIHGDPAPTNALIRRSDGALVAIDPRGAVLGVREATFGHIAASMFAPKDIGPALSAALRFDPTLRPDRLAAVAAGHAVSVAGWRNREWAVAEALNEGSLAGRVEMLAAQIRLEPDPLIREAALEAFTERSTELLDAMIGIHERVEKQRSEADDYLTVAKELAAEVFTSPAWRIHQDDRHPQKNPNLQRAPDGSLLRPHAPKGALVAVEAPIMFNDFTGDFAMASRLKTHVAATDIRYRISVITPVTRPHLLADALASLEQQRRAIDPTIEVEWVLMSDGHVPGFDETVSSLRATNPHTIIRVLDAMPERQGPGPLRNIMATAIGGATGHLICTLDDDDRLPPDSLKSRIEPFLNIPDIGWTAGDVLGWHPKDMAPGAPVATTDLDFNMKQVLPPGLVTVREVRRHIEERGYMPTWPHTVMYRADIFRAVAGDKASYAGEDGMRNTAVAALTPGVKVGGFVYCWRLQGQSITRSDTWNDMLRHENNQNREFSGAAIRLMPPVGLPPLSEAASRSAPSRVLAAPSSAGALEL